MAVAWDSLRTRSSRAWLGALLFAVAAVGLAWARAPIEEALIARFGPPSAEMQERYGGGTGEAQGDHAGGSAADYSPRLRKALQAGTRPSIDWLPYD